VAKILPADAERRPAVVILLDRFRQRERELSSLFAGDHRDTGYDAQPHSIQP